MVKHAQHSSDAEIELTDAEVAQVKGAVLPVDELWKMRLKSACDQVLRNRGIKGACKDVNIDFYTPDYAVYTLKFWLL